MPGALHLGVGGTTRRKRRSESRGLLSHSLRAASVSPSHLLGMPGFVFVGFGVLCCLSFVKVFPASLIEMPNYGTLFKTATIVMMRAAPEQKKNQQFHLVNAL